MTRLNKYPATGAFPIGRDEAGDSAEMDPKFDTRERLIAAATRLFAAQGYGGASISKIASELHLTKQALLHHFGSKERVYSAAVTKQVAEIKTLLAVASQEAQTPEDQLDAFFLALCGFGLEDPDRLMLVVREVFDQVLPVQVSGLKDLLEQLNALVLATDRWQGGSPSDAMVVVCQLLGAVQCFLSTEVAQGAVFGAEAYETARDVHYGLVPATVSALIR
ncbi:TetR/AcrR family transcriptional regulator [Tritonibacter multivorans]|nr:TetR/AcrR family transcriptional regulator [Tritonibacter multivorans]MDA7422553.1 TetR/AcrR family transcriptional regulator [Tritonibacter multivorans]